MSEKDEFDTEDCTDYDDDSSIEILKDMVEEAKAAVKENPMYDLSYEAGLPVQYGINGPGFTPTTKTFKTLPAAAYVIRFVNDVPTLIVCDIHTDDILRLPDTKSDEIVMEIRKFWTLKDKFKKYGFLHKRGFLLYGPPGSGKTATVSTVIKEIIEAGGLTILADTKPSLVADMLDKIRKIEPDRNMVVVFEDIDELIKEFREADLLALLDGEKQVDNVVFLATTNYPEVLDNRIKNRPSRFDRVEKIGFPSPEARRVFLFAKLGRDLDPTSIEKWVQLTEGFSIAHIKELILNVMCLENSLESQVTRLKNMKKHATSEEEENKVGF